MTKNLLFDLATDECSKSDYSILDGEFMLASNNPKKRAGRIKFSETRHPIYRGVRRRNSGKWVCELREPNKKSRIWLGTYPTVEMAARAHDVAAIALRGKLACLNFADSAWRLPIPASMETKDIQKAAAEAAAAFHPSMPVDAAVAPLTEVDQFACFEDFNMEEEWMVLQEEVHSPEEEVFLPEENVFSSEDNVISRDEEDIYSMPWLISSMAEGLMLPPPLQYS